MKTNHDRERSTALTYKDGPIYPIAHVYLLGWNYGTPEVLSSYTFTNNDAGGPNKLYGTCSGTAGTNGWQCQHRWPMISAMVKFNNGAQGAEINHAVTGTKRQLAWGRGGNVEDARHRRSLFNPVPGSYGFVAINLETKAVWKTSLVTDLPDGDYCDLLHGPADPMAPCPPAGLMYDCFRRSEV